LPLENLKNKGIIKVQIKREGLTPPFAAFGTLAGTSVLHFYVRDIDGEDISERFCKSAYIVYGHLLSALLSLVLEA
jgi:hypothetical protein